MSDDVKESEVWVMRQAAALSSSMILDPRNAKIPGWALTVDALALVMAGAFLLPCYRQLADRLRDKHREEHDGSASDQYEECGYYEAAAYAAQTGRQLVDDLGLAGPLRSAQR